jgi:hypothetical protein
MAGLGKLASKSLRMSSTPARAPWVVTTSPSIETLASLDALDQGFDLNKKTMNTN